MNARVAGYPADGARLAVKKGRVGFAKSDPLHDELPNIMRRSTANSDYSAGVPGQIRIKYTQLEEDRLIDKAKSGSGDAYGAGFTGPGSVLLVGASALTGLASEG